jgi:hypothetical protein
MSGKEIGGREIPPILYEQIIPTAIMVGFSALLGVIVWWRWRPTTRELIIALFTGFVTAYFVLTIVGTFFRGHGMELQLYWPWTELQAEH